MILYVALNSGDLNLFSYAKYCMLYIKYREILSTIRFSYKQRISLKRVIPLSESDLLDSHRLQKIAPLSRPQTQNQPRDISSES